MTAQNLGWAVVCLTLFIRLAILPFSIIGEKNALKNENLEKEIEDIAKSYRHDPILQKEEIRKILKKKKVSAWATVVVIVMQALVFLLLYQVFVRGVTGEKMLFYLYDWNDFPGTINIYFYGFDLSQRHEIIWPLLVALLLAFEIYIDFSKKKKVLDLHDLFFFILYPASIFLFLWWLPMVKSLFFFTTISFSIIVKYLVIGFLKNNKK